MNQKKIQNGDKDKVPHKRRRAGAKSPSYKTPDGTTWYVDPQTNSLVKFFTKNGFVSISKSTKSKKPPKPSPGQLAFIWKFPKEKKPYMSKNPWFGKLKRVTDELFDNGYALQDSNLTPEQWEDLELRQIELQEQKYELERYSPENTKAQAKQAKQAKQAEIDRYRKLKTQSNWTPEDWQFIIDHEKSPRRQVLLSNNREYIKGFSTGGKAVGTPIVIPNPNVNIDYEHPQGGYNYKYGYRYIDLVSGTSVYVAESTKKW
jgi:hypothetical protein